MTAPTPDELCDAADMAEVEASLGAEAAVAVSGFPASVMAATEGVAPGASALDIVLNRHASFCDDFEGRLRTLRADLECLSKDAEQARDAARADLERAQADLKAALALVEKLEGLASADAPTILARLRAIIDDLKPHTGWASSSDILDNLGRLDLLTKRLIGDLERSQRLHQRALKANRALRGPRKRKTVLHETMPRDRRGRKFARKAGKR